MHLTIAWPDGHVRDSLLLVLGRTTLRVIPAQSDDVVELRFQDGVWCDEQEAPVSFDFIAALNNDAATVCSWIYPVVRSAAS